VSRPKRQQRKDTEGRLKQEVERLRRELAERERQLAEQAKRIADLERQLALRQQNSITTSKPPSSDGLAGQQRERGRRTKSRRTRGGQPGHPGHSRPLVPPERVNATIDLVPDTCRHCQRPLHARNDLSDPRRHQVTELPPIEAHITEYRCHRRRCPACGKTTQAPLPDEIAGQFGPQLTALIAYLTVVCRLPRLVVQRLLEGALQIPISLGSTQNAWEEASAAVAFPYEELEAALPTQPVLNADETGHRTNAAKRWLWTLVAPTFVFYAIATSRGSDVLRRLLGVTFGGVLGSDRLPTYTKYASGQRQFCWAHFTRNLLSAQELAQTAAGETLLPGRPGAPAPPFSTLASFPWRPHRAGRAAHTPGAHRQSTPDREEVLRARGAACQRRQQRRVQSRACAVRPSSTLLYVRSRGGCRADKQCRKCRRRHLRQNAACRIMPPWRESNAVVSGGSRVCGLRRRGIITGLPRRPTMGPTAGSGQGEAHAPWCEPGHAL